TPPLTYGDLTGLNRLRSVELAVRSRVERDGDAERMRVTVENTGKDLAFMVRLSVTKGADGEHVTPVFWDENYFSLLAGETREVAATYDLSSLDGKPAGLGVDGWNVVIQTLRRNLTSSAGRDK